MTQTSKYLISNSSDLDTLEGMLGKQIYVHGNAPGCEDSLLYYQWFSHKSEPDQTKYPNLWAWYALISLYNVQVLELWKNVKAEEKKGGKKEEAPKKDKKEKEDKVDHTKPAPKEAPADECDDLFADDDPEEEAKRKELEKKIKEKKEAEKQKKPALIQKSIILLDVKVWEIEQNLDDLSKKIFAELVKEGLVWKQEYQILDVAFGVKKLRIGCVIEDEKVSVDDDIVEYLQSWENDIQSVDIVSFNKI